MFILKPKIKMNAYLLWEPLLRLKYKLGFKKYDILVDIGLSDRSFQKYMKIVLSRKTVEKDIVENQKSLLKGIILEPSHNSSEKLLNELLMYAYELELASKRLRGEISEYAKKISMWNKYMRFPDESARSIVKMLRRKVFDKDGIFMLKGLLKEGFGLSAKVTLDRIEILSGSGQVVYLPLYLTLEGASINVYDATYPRKHLNVPYTSLLNNDVELMREITKMLRKPTF